MLNFIRKYQDKITSVLSGFDRLVFRGTLRMLSFVDGMKRHLSYADVPRCKFGEHVERMTAQLRKASLAHAKESGRPDIYLQSSQTRKEAVAHRVLEKHPVDTGLICVLKCLEPCRAYEMYRNKATKQLELRLRIRKCLHLYHYYLDPEFGFMHARIQTWYPFSIQIYLNAREWLARRLDAAGLRYTRYENAFLHLEDPAHAQCLMDAFLQIPWPQTLDAIAHRLNPAHDQMFGPMRYYWSGHQTEWATDLLFRSAADLAQLYPRLVRGAITAFAPRDVMRFLGKRFQANFEGESVSHYQPRPEGLRVKHEVNTNGLKMYDKGGRILRVETTLNNPLNLKVYRALEGGDPRGKAWRQLRKGVADLHRRAEVCQRANERYLDALAEFDTDTTLGQLLTPLCRRVSYAGTKMRALRLWSPEDRALLEAISRPEHLLTGFCNRDLAIHLFPHSQTDLQSQRSASGKISYRIRLLRAHGLIAKLPNTRRYRITPKGRQVAAAVLLAQHATIKQLNPKVA